MAVGPARRRNCRRALLLRPEAMQELGKVISAETGCDSSAWGALRRSVVPSDYTLTGSQSAQAQDRGESGLIMPPSRRVTRRSPHVKVDGKQAVTLPRRGGSALLR